MSVSLNFVPWMHFDCPDVFPACPHVTDEEIEALAQDERCSGSGSMILVDLGIRPRVAGKQNLCMGPHQDAQG